ncbi:MAG: IgGFc-binding protein, partial [Bacteroidales bacterium]|nr:IgGFc-binding protein [Bacteroidales bacterium]
MRKTTQILLVLYSVFSCISIHGQFSNEDCISTEGTDFWFTFPENGRVDSSHKTIVVVTSRFDCDYQIELANNPSEIIKGNLKKDSIRAISLPYKDVEAVGDITIQTKGVHLISTEPVSVYIFNYSKGSCDASMIYPTHLLDKEYYDFDYAAARGQGETDLFTLVATDDNTSVEIEINIGATRLDGTCTNDSITHYSINLNKGEVFPMNFCANPYMVSHIVANKSIAVYTGVRFGQNTYGGNLVTTAMFEQIPPVKLYSHKSIYIPNKPYLGNYENSFYGVGIDAPDVLVNGDNPLVYPRTANGFQVRYSGISTTQPMIIETSSPSFLQFAIYRNGSSGFNQSRLNILSTEFSTINAQFLSFPLPGIDSHYVNILVKNKDIGNLELDHIPISPSSFTPILGSAFSYAQLNISAGPHLLRASTPKASFQAYAYGLSLDGTNVNESYAYMLGFNNLVHIDLFEEEPILTCYNSTQLIAKEGFRTYEWNTGETSRDI